MKIVLVGANWRFRSVLVLGAFVSIVMPLSTLSSANAESLANSSRSNVWCPGAQGLEAPRGENVTLVDGVVRISWNPVPGAKNYLYNVRVLNGNQWESITGSSWQSLPADQTSIGVVPPEGSVRMLVNLAARNDCSQSANNAWQQNIPRVAIAPTQVRLTALDSEMRVSWDSDCPFFVCGGQTYVARLEPGGLECSVVGGSECLISGVQRDQDYVAYVVARNQYGPSTVMQSNVARLIKPPNVPASVKVTSAKTSASVQWRKSPAGAGLRYLVTTNPGAKQCRSTKSGCVIKGLKPNTRYQFTVIALNDGGSSNPRVVTAATKPLRPTAPARPARPARPSPAPAPPPPPPPEPEKPVVPIS
jgi:hypothetical protein